MSNALVVELEAISRTFAAAVVDAMKRASLADILEASGSRSAARPANAPTASTPAKRGPGRPRKDASPDAAPTRRVRGNPSAKLAAVNAIVAYVKAHPGQPGEVIRKAVGLDRARWSPALRHCIDAQLLSRRGEKRAAKYWAT